MTPVTAASAEMCFWFEARRRCSGVAKNRRVRATVGLNLLAIVNIRKIDISMLRRHGNIESDKGASKQSSGPSQVHMSFSCRWST